MQGGSRGRRRARAQRWKLGRRRRDLGRQPATKREEAASGGELGDLEAHAGGCLDGEESG